MSNKRTVRVSEVYVIILSALVPGSALSAIIKPCPIAALVCAILAIALAWEQFRADKKKQQGNAERIEAVEAWNHKLTEDVDALRAVFEQVDFEDMKSRSEEVRSALSSLKLSSLYGRK